MSGVITIRVGAFYEKDAVYISRGGKGKLSSPLHNPNRLVYDTPEERVSNIKQFHLYFNQQIKEKNQPFINELKRLYDIALTEKTLLLGCFCNHPGKPHKVCHGDVIAEFLKQKIEKTGNVVDIKKD